MITNLRAAIGGNYIINWVLIKMSRISGTMTTQSRSKILRRTVLWELVEEIPKPISTLLIITSIAVPIFLWWLITTFGNIDPKFLPSPAKVMEAFGRLWSTRELLKDTVASLWRVGVGFFLASILSIPLGILMGSYATIRALLEPIFGLMRYMPAPAFIPLLILYLGVGEEPKILLILLGYFL